MRQAVASRRRLKNVFLTALGLAVAACVGAAVVVEHIGLAPRTLAPYIEKRTSGHNPTIVRAGQFIGAFLMNRDRGTAMPVDITSRVGAQPDAVGSAASQGIVVGNPEELRSAIGKAQAGDVITLLPGLYRFNGNAIDVNRPGKENAPIVVRAARPNSVHIEFDQVEGFRVSAPWWRFEKLSIRGVCGDDTYCEHAFHVVGGGHHFVASNNTIADFNAHFKINGNDEGIYPDDGLIVTNTLYNTHARQTANPVVPIDLVGASRWAIRANVIKDFVKLDGNGVSYGGFAKGAGSQNVFERNLVWCEDKLKSRPGQRIGLSLGGGGTGAQWCRDHKCITEQQGGMIRANLIVSCSDVGIYLNSAADSHIDDNTLIDTSGIDVRFATSSARLDGNLIDGAIRERDGGLAHLQDNRTTPLWQIYVGHHPVRDLFRAPLEGDFAWRGNVPQRSSVRKGIDLCDAKPVTAYGAFEDFASCRNSL